MIPYYHMLGSAVQTKLFFCYRPNFLSFFFVFLMRSHSSYKSSFQVLSSCSCHMQREIVFTAKSSETIYANADCNWRLNIWLELLYIVRISHIDSNQSLFDGGTPSVPVAKAYLLDSYKVMIRVSQEDANFLGRIATKVKTSAVWFLHWAHTGQCKHHQTSQRDCAGGRLRPQTKATIHSVPI